MSHISYYTEKPRLTRSGLIGWGVTLIVLGCLCGLLTLGIVISRATAFLHPSPAHPTKAIATVLSETGFSLAAAVAMIWTGIGSCRGDRWVRPIILIGSILFALLGLLVIALTVGLILGRPLTAANHAANPRSIRAIVTVFAIGLEAALFLVFPAAFSWFYWRRQTAQTLAILDQSPRRWTDDIPIPLLGWVMLCLVLAAGDLLDLGTSRLIFFAAVLRGPPVAAVLFSRSVILVIGAWLCYRRRMEGWWMTVLLMLLGVASGIIFAMWGDATQLQVRPAGVNSAGVRSPYVGEVARMSVCVLDTLFLAFGVYLRRVFHQSSGTTGAILNANAE